MPLFHVGRTTFASLLCLSFCCSTFAQQTTNESVLILKNARIHTVSDAGTFVGSIVIGGDKIVAMGADIDLPKDGQVFDLTGQSIVPGLIDSRSVLWLTDAAIKEGNSKGALNAIDGIDPWQENWREVSRQGVTAVYVQPANSGSLGGYGAVLRVAPAESRDDLLIKAEAGLQAAFGITGATSRDRLAQYEKLRKAIQSVIDGNEDDEDEEEETTQRPNRAQPGRRPPGGRRNAGRRGGQQRQTEAVTLPDKTKDVLKKVVAGEMPLRIEAHHSDAMRHAQQLATDFEIQVIVDGASNGPGDSQRSVPLIVGPLIETSSVPGYRKNAEWDWLAEFSQRGGQWAVSTLSTQNRGSRLLRVQAAAAIAHGVDRNEALKAVTIHPARLLGVDDRIGSLQVGKQADIAVFAGDPLDPSVAASMVISKGEITWQTEAVIRESDPIVSVDLPESLPAKYVVLTERLWHAGRFNAGIIAVQDGKIVAVGSDVAIDKSWPVFDFGNTVITPGLVAAHTTLGLHAALDDASESDQSHILAVDAFDPLHPSVKEMLEGGFIHIGFAPASSSTSPGSMGQIRLGGQSKVMANAIAGQFTLQKSARKNERFPCSLNGQLQLVESMFGGESPDTNVYVSATIERSLLAEKQSSIQAVLKRNRKAVFEVSSNLEIESALKIAKAHNLDAALITGDRIREFGDAIRDNAAGLIVRSFTGNEVDSQWDEIASASRAGVPIAFAGETPEQIRMTAALAVACGMPEDVALQGLMKTGSRVVGMVEGTAELQENGTADFVIWSGSPLNLASAPLGVVVDGKLVLSDQGK